MAALIADPFRAARLILTLRRQGIMDNLVLQAIETVDRGAFVDEELDELAFEDCALPIPCGQLVLRPSTVARCLSALRLTRGKEDRVLLVGSGSGYSSALVAQLSRHVWGVERFDRLTEQSRRKLFDLGVQNVTIRQGDGLQGWQEHGPFDRILVMGTVRDVPRELKEQIARGGCLVAMKRAGGPESSLVIERQTYSGGIESWRLPDVTVSRLKDGVGLAL